MAEPRLSPCVSLMERQILIQRFHHILSLASLAYTFTILHTIQYSMRGHESPDNDNNDPTAQTVGASDSTSYSASSTVDTPLPTTVTASTSENIEKPSGQWTDNKVRLLLDYVEANCTLTTMQGLNMKKSQFSKVHATVKTKDASQCHYKWNHVRIFSSTTWVFPKKNSICH
jgi:hypothetical protein